MALEPNFAAEVHPTIGVEYRQLRLNIGHVSRFGIAVHQLFYVKAFGDS
jgi:hypothetical protein